MDELEREPLANVLARTHGLTTVDPGPVTCTRCSRIGGSFINGLCGRCFGVNPR